MPPNGTLRLVIGAKSARGRHRNWKSDTRAHLREAHLSLELVVAVFRCELQGAVEQLLQNLPRLRRMPAEHTAPVREPGCEVLSEP